MRPRRARSLLEEGSREGMEMKNGAHSDSVDDWRSVVLVDRMCLILYLVVPGRKPPPVVLIVVMVVVFYVLCDTGRVGTCRRKAGRTEGRAYIKLCNRVGLPCEFQIASLTKIIEDRKESIFVETESKTPKPVYGGVY